MEMDEPLVISEISEEEKSLIENQLQLILKSSFFSSAKKMRRFLEYVVERTLAGNGSLLKQYTIGVEALKYPYDFDSDENPAVRILGGRVRERLRKFYKNTENNEIIISIKKGTYTPEFIRQSEQHKAVNNSANPTKNKDDIETSSGPRIALISFTDKTESDESNRLILRLTDILAKELSKFVLSKCTIFNPFSDKAESARLHSEIDSDFKLFLSIQEQADNKYELLSRLTDPNSEVLWSESFEVDANILIASQESIIERLVTTLVDTHQGKLHIHWARNLLLNKDKIPLKFHAAVYYRQFYDKLNLSAFAKAVEACESALERNTDDILANLMLADLCRWDYVHFYGLIDSPLSKGLQYAEKATHLRQDSHEAHYILGQILYNLGDWDRCLQEFQLARKLNSYNAVIEYACGYHYCLIGQWEKGLGLVRKAMTMSKNYPSWYYMIIALNYYRLEKYQEALTEAKKIVAPSIPHGPLLRCISYAKLGNLSKAQKELNELIKRVPDLGENGKSKLLRLLGNKELSNQVWVGLLIAMKS